MVGLLCLRLPVPVSRVGGGLTCRWGRDENDGNESKFV